MRLLVWKVNVWVGLGLQSLRDVSRIVSCESACCGRAGLCACGGGTYVGMRDQANDGPGRCRRTEIRCTKGGNPGSVLTLTYFTDVY